MTMLSPFRHSRAGGNPESNIQFDRWIPACAGMTIVPVSVVPQ
jgi:hypothetical protein